MKVNISLPKILRKIRCTDAVRFSVTLMLIYSF